MGPPYPLADGFRHALRLCPKVIMLLRIAFLESERRSDILDGPLTRILVFKNRLPMMQRAGWTGPKASSSIPFAWLVVERDHTGPAAFPRISWRQP